MGESVRTNENQAKRVGLRQSRPLVLFRPAPQPTSTATNAVLDVRLFRDLFANAAVAELTHADMLQLRDALVRSGVGRSTVNSRLWRVKFMIGWALDEALIPAAVKAELTQVQGVKRGRTSSPERRPVRPVDDATISATVERMMPNTADMVRLHRVTGMRPCELCALRWSLIDTSRTPWVYRVPPEANKNEWRGEFGFPRVVCLGHTGGGCVTDVYTFDALEEEMIRAATPAVEALG